MSKKSPWLRLVYDRSRYVTDDGSPLRLQYCLPLAIPHNVIVADVSEFQYSDLERAVRFSAPTWIFDFRRNARFDVLSGGRVHAFRTFERYGAQYVDIMGLVPRGLPFLEMKRQSLWNRTFRSVLMRRKVEGPYLILCDDLNKFLDMSQVIMRGLGYASKSRLSLSLLDMGLVRYGDIAFREVM